MTSILRPIPGANPPPPKRQINTLEARKIVLRAWSDATNEKEVPSETAIQAALAVFRAESGYGTWKGALEGSNNWGANHCPNKGSDCSKEAQKGFDCALGSDTYDGTEKTRKPQCFKVYATPEDGAKDAIKDLCVRRKGVRPAMESGDLLLLSKKMQDLSYYSKGVTIRHYAMFLYGNVVEVARRCGVNCLWKLRACRDCAAGAGEACAKGCPGTYYEGDGGNEGKDPEWDVVPGYLPAKTGRPLPSTTKAGIEPSEDELDAFPAVAVLLVGVVRGF